VALEIRRARPEDAPFLAWATLAAGRSHLETSFWDLLIPASELERLAFLERLILAEPASWWHWGLFFVAERDAGPAAALSGFDPATLAPPNASVEAAVAASDWSAARARESFARATAFFTCVHEPEPGAWIVESVATRPEARRGGLARALLARVLDAGRRRGHRVAHLSCMIGNARAQRVYERVGFSVVEEKRHADFEKAVGCPGIARMRAAL
jgi:GNAT superfamily N-acetyltransferase